MTGIEGEPASVEENLKPGAEVHRSRIPRHADIAEIAGAVTGRNIHAAAQLHGEMGKVPADTDAFGMTFRSGAVHNVRDGIRIGLTGWEFDCGRVTA